MKNRPRGTQDIYPPHSLVYQKIQQIISEILRKSNYQPIIFPTYEYEELFTNSLGSVTDIIHKEMFSFSDRKGRKLALRPEGTTSVVRLVCQNKLVQESYPLKIYYWANMFRYERPQKGRYREFWQLGVELINALGIWADWQILKLVYDILASCGVKDFRFYLNYLGDNNTKEKYKEKIKVAGGKIIENLCSDCQRRYETNPLRILDCSYCSKNFSFPAYHECWTEENKNYIKELSGLLDKFYLPYQYNYHLVRGLDYYTGLVFEVDLPDEKAIVGGGRYDQLYSEIGNINLPAIGFAFGVDRLVNYLEKEPKKNFEVLEINNKVDIFFFVLVSEIYWKAVTWKTELEKYSLVAEYNLEVGKLKNLTKTIDYYQPKLIAILGEKELKSKKILIKDLRKRHNFWVKKKELTEQVYKYLKQEKKDSSPLSHTKKILGNTLECWTK